ncbi:C6 transcription factor [Penicillium verhagenii]|uniref:C6 transcription factor n=1 Tax=Penicillium verhagenii TaxID=1562060 RepID=UPI0025455E32|nr:C6 transcription factor [Penicillium verhagenii]KAJ5939500.1 C6 transcription factor [Penicillium verhagenii]
MSERALKRRKPMPGMAQNPAVLTTVPLDNLLTEIHRLLGPTWALPPYDNLLPDYIKPPSSHLQIEDLNFLIRKGAFDVPQAELGQEILKSYIRHVHPHMPFLDLDLFSNAIFNGNINSIAASTAFQDGIEDDGQEAISLLLFQAVMFAGAFFVDLKYLYAAGFLSRRSALETLFQRARALHDFDCEEDDLAIMQSLLLMTYWYENPDRNKDGRHWINVCVSLAYKVGLYPDASDETAEGRFKNLLWWSMFTRDRLIALPLQEAPLIKNEVYLSMPVPTAADLGIFPPRPRSRNSRSKSKSKSKPKSTGSGDDSDSDLDYDYASACYQDNENSLALIFIEKIKLCRCIRDDMFSWDLQRLSSSNPSTDKFKSRRRTSLALSKLDLDDWLAGLPPKIAFRPKPFLAPTDADVIFHVHCAWLQMVYCEIHSTLHRQLEFFAEHDETPRSPQQQKQQQLSSSPVLLGAAEMTTVIQDLCQKHLICYLPTSVVPMVLRAGIIHIQQMCTGDAQVESKGSQGLLQCIRALQQLSQVYGSALFLSSILGGQAKGSLGSSSAMEILKGFDMDTLDRLTSGYSESIASAMVRITEPYDVDVISRIRSRRESICY